MQILIAAAIALIGLPAAVYNSYSVRLRHEQKVKRLLDLTDKLGEEAAGRKQIQSALDLAVLELAYFLQYPKTWRNRISIAFGVLSIGGAVLTLYFSRHDLKWLALLALVLSYACSYEFAVVSRNNRLNDEITRAMFVYLRAPSGLARQKVSLIVPIPRVGVGDVLMFAANVRDRSIDRTFSSVDAVNVGLLEARAEIRYLRLRRRRIRFRLFKLKVKYRWLRFWSPLRLWVRFAVTTLLARLRIRLIAWREPERGRELRQRLDQKVEEVKVILKSPPYRR